MKFLVDAMMGRLARLLRILGYDSVYAEEVQASAPDDLLLDYAKKHDRLIITRDLPFHNRAKDYTFYAKEEDPYKVLRLLKEKYHLNIDFNIDKARCSVCNSQLEKIDKILVKDKVKSDTFTYYDNFYECLNPDCKKIYWRGTHIEDILKRLKNTFQS